MHLHDLFLILMTLKPQTTALLFPGQGSQLLGMGKELSQTEVIAREIFTRADEILGYSLSDLCWEGPAEELNDTLNTQPALLVHSTAVHRVLQSQYPKFIPAFTAGHSLGEISALVAAESLSFEDAVILVRERGAAMQHAGKLHPGGMAAVLGLTIEQVEKACELASSGVAGGVWVANDNCPGQIVISGDIDALTNVMDKLPGLGARKVVRLAVSIPAHSPRMIPAQEQFNRALSLTPFEKPQIPIIGNGNALPLSTEEAVVKDLGAQLTVRVRWTETIRYLIGAGVETFVEVGSGKVLTALLKRIDRNVTGFALDTPDSFGPLKGIE